MTDTQLEVLGSRLSRSVSKLRTAPLVAVGLLGLVMVAAHVVAELRGNPPVLSGLLLEVGAGLLLFAVLLVLQVRIVENAVSAARALTAQEMEGKANEGSENPLTAGDFHDEIGPLAVASAVVRDLADGSLRDAWLLLDSNLRLCRAMAWLYNNREQLQLPDLLTDEVERLAVALADLRDIPGGLTDHFIASESEQYAQLLKGFDDDGWGWSQRRRIVGPRHEMVLALPLPADAPHGVLVNQPLVVPHSVKILISNQPVAGGTLYQVAGINYEAAPLPTWPPTWWIIDDPAAATAHPGLQ